LALIAGPLLGAGLAFAAEALDNTVKTPEQAQRTLGVPTLGVVPMFSLDYDPFGLGKAGKTARETAAPTAALAWDADSQGERSGEPPVVRDASLATKDHELVMVSAPKSMASEAFRTVRTAILLSSADNPPKVILVTSGQKSEGKTTLITNLSVTIANSGSSVLLIDADLRRPAVHKHFGLDLTAPGLVDHLTGQAELEKVIHKTGIENLSVITAGPIPPNPSELLGSKKMTSLLDLLSKRFDYVFVDAPPILPVTDAVVLSRSVDGVVLVVRGQETQTHVAREAVAKLRQVGAKVLGTVLNDVDLRSGDYYYYRRGYYSYYREEDGNQRRKKRAAG
jgi:capsular exopolysaccharide synthesis family protein